MLSVKQGSIKYHFLSLWYDATCDWTQVSRELRFIMLYSSIVSNTKKILRKNQNSFLRDWSIILQILTCHRIIKGVRAKNLKATLLFEGFSKVLHYVRKGKIAQIPLTYDRPKETVTAIMTFYKNTEDMVCLFDGEIGFFDIISTVFYKEIHKHHISL